MAERGHQGFSFIRPSLHSRNPVLLGSSYALTTAWIYFSVVRNSYSRPCLLLNSQLVDLCKLGFFYLVMFYLDYFVFDYWSGLPVI